MALVNVTVVRLSGAPLPNVELEASRTVWELKEALAQECPVIAQDQTLLLDTVELEDCMILSKVEGLHASGTVLTLVRKEPWPPSWYPRGKYQYEGKDVYKIETRGSQEKATIYFVDGSEMYFHGQVEIIDVVQLLIGQFGFDKHYTQLTGWAAWPDCVNVEAVPKEDPAEWEKLSTMLKDVDDKVERRVKEDPFHKAKLKLKAAPLQTETVGKAEPPSPNLNQHALLQPVFLMPGMQQGPMMWKGGPVMGAAQVMGGKGPGGLVMGVPQMMGGKGSMVGGPQMMGGPQMLGGPNPMMWNLHVQQMQKMQMMQQKGRSGWYADDDEGMMPFMPASMQGGAEMVGASEWRCTACGFQNRGRNAVCGGSGRLGCKAQREVATSSTSASSLMNQQPMVLESLGGKGYAGVGKGHEWVCSECRFANKACNAQCGGAGRLGCNAPKPFDWPCSCGFVNKFSNLVCGGSGNMGCKAMKPAF